MRLLKQSQTSQALMFLMVDSTDHISGKTGLSPTVTLSKNGGSFASPSGAVTEVGNGYYKVAGNATDTATLGPLILHATGTGADPTDVEYMVVAFDPLSATDLGLSRLDATISSRSTLDASGVRTAIGLASANLDTQLDALPTAAENADAIWDEATAGHTTAGTYGGRVIRATNSNVEVQVTGSNHVAADVHKFQENVIDSEALADSAGEDIADRILGRNIAGGSSSGRIVKDALRFLRNRFVVSAGTLTVYAEDDTTTAWTATVTGDAAATPIVESNPA